MSKRELSRKKLAAMQAAIDDLACAKLRRIRDPGARLNAALAAASPLLVIACDAIADLTEQAFGARRAAASCLSAIIRLIGETAALEDAYKAQKDRPQ